MTLSAPRPATSPSLLPPVPSYLERDYWWAYVHPRAVRVFERPWLVNLILFGHYRRLCDAALAALSGEGGRVQGRTLQLACVYGDLTPRLIGRLAPEARLDVVDILPVQLQNLRAKLSPDARVQLQLADASQLGAPDAHYDQVLAFFLLHEQPADVRSATLAQALRVLRPGGRLVIVDYHRPAPWHPLRLLLQGVFRALEPYARDLWRQQIADLLPAGTPWHCTARRLFFGGVYQCLTFSQDSSQALPHERTGKGMRA